MSDYNDPSIDMSVNIDTDVSKEMEALYNLEKKAKEVTKAFEQLGNAYQRATSQQVNGFQNNALPSSWDSLYKRELQSISDPQKRDAFLRMMDSTVPDAIKYAPASSTGKYHPNWANIEGGLVRHSRAVAQGALSLATMYGYTGNRDDLLIAGLGHDAQKLGKTGRFYNPSHALQGAEYLKSFGLGAAADLTLTHMGTEATGAKKGSPMPTTQGQRILAEADWLMSRKYAENFVKWEGDQSTLDMKGLREEAIKRKEAKEGKDGYLDILGDVETQEKNKEKAAKEWERSWANTVRSARNLYGVLIDIAKLGLAQIVVGGKVIEAGSNALSTGNRAFTGQTGDQVLGNRLAAGIVGLGVNTLNDEITALASKRGSFSLTGEAGDLLPMALAKNLDSLLLSDKPVNEVYWQAADAFAKQITEAKKAGDDRKAKGLFVLAEKTLGAGARSVIDYSIVNNITPSSLTERMAPDGGIWGWQGQIQDVNREFKIAMDSIKDSFTDLYTAFMRDFGNPVTIWFAKTLQALMRGAAGKDAYNTIWSRGNYSFSNIPDYSDDYIKEINKRKVEWLSTTGAALQKVISGDIPVDLATDMPGWRAVKNRDGSVYYIDPSGKSNTYMSELNRIKGQKAADILSTYGINVDSSVGLVKLGEIASKLYKEGLAAFSTGVNVFDPYNIEAQKNYQAIQFLGMQQDPRLQQLYKGVQAYFPEYTEGYKGLDASVGNIIEALIDQILRGVITPGKAVEDLKALRAERNSISMNINATFPNATNAAEISKGILDAAEELKIAMDSYAIG